jgi:hypothetical protein
MGERPEPLEAKTMKSVQRTIRLEECSFSVPNTQFIEDSDVDGTLESLDERLHTGRLRTPPM